ncbi:MAG TPA: glycoside hydrolase family 3 C-terminal domain-containing protein [Pseudonocardiaceae bacterium]|nr:glycoside hydrolase family 3 C-terminal domain-containing protein [Pseudonocardiaceae bacterium]
MRLSARFGVLTATVAAAISVLALPGSAQSAPPTNPACPWVGQHASPAQRAAEVLAKMTLEEKIQMVHGDSSSPYAGQIPAIPDLCIPALNLEDGPGGVGDGMTGVTQLPAPVAAAASWDTSLVSQYGAVIGNEQWGKGANVDLGPTVNIVRDPRWGRAFESYGEDPYLAGQIGVADIKGVQSQGVLAQVKHLAVYNQETNRNTAADDAIVDPRTLNELYLPQFQDAVQQGQVASVMCSYSTINGSPACQNDYLQNQKLKDDWNFPGFVTSDWGATHSTVDSANNGLDMEMPDDQFFGSTLETAVQAGQVPLSRLNDMVTRILTEEFRFGLFDRPATGSPSAVVTNAAHASVAQNVAEQGTVLLKNANSALPLNTTTAKSIAVIGDDAGPDALTSGGGSASVTAGSIVTPYQGIKTRAGSGVDVQYAAGTYPNNGQLPVVDPSYFGSGLTAQYYNNMTLSGTPVLTQTDPNVNFDWGTNSAVSPGPGVNATQWSVKWTGTITAPATGSYTFSLTSDDGSRLFVNGTQVIDNWRDQGANTETGTVTLTAGQSVPVEIDYYQNGGDDLVNLGWQIPGQPTPLDAAVALAKSSSTAVVFASNFESEGSDLSGIDLSTQQNQLISAVAAVNPNTIVVLNTGSAVTMPWLDSVRGVLEAWYPGQQDGTAIASVLFGDTNPSGKLPVTFPKSLADVPASTPAQWPGVNGQVDYSEGMDVGYRWYDAKDIAPLFAFGSGLSYTTFGFSHLTVGPGNLGPNGQETVTASVTNTGHRAGADVVQLYLSEPTSTGEPPKQLKGFQKVQLNPGQTKQVRFTLSGQDVSYWDTNAQNWTEAAGHYQVMLGDSSDNLPLAGGFAVTRTTGPRYVAVTAPALQNPGTTATVSATFTNGSTETVRNTALKLTAPTGWTVTSTPGQPAGNVGPGKTATASWQVTAPANATAGSTTLTATASYLGDNGPTTTTGTATESVPYASFAAALNNTGISDDANPTGANFDGGGYSYSAQALASVSVTPGATVGSTGLTWPDVPVATPDNVETSGQSVALSGAGSQLAFLGTGTFGTQSGPVTVTYTDGSTSTGTLSLPDWYGNAATAGNTLVATTPHWNVPPTSTLDPNHQVSIYDTAIPLTSGKTVAAVTLPDNSDLHLFAIGIN